ncbi:MAG: hypothetical protein ACO3FT_04925 [Ilumatobacteraceae bacterium]|jgi:hypothetical protein
MGLDSYLYKRTYVKNWDYMTPEERHTITIAGPTAADIKPARISEIIEQVAYWRKANAIHGWFVRNCQDGVDDCRDASVEVEQLIDLRDLCRELLALRTTAPAEAAARAWCTNVLPPTVGCFFGSTELDEGYWDHLADTDRMLTAILDELGEGLYGRWSFTYSSSW